MGEIEESLLLNFETQNLKHRIIASVFDGGTNICDFLRHHFLHLGKERGLHRHYLILHDVSHFTEEISNVEAMKVSE